MKGLILNQLGSLPRKHKSNAWYMRQVQIDRDESEVWAREEKRELKKDDLPRDTFKPLKEITQLLP